MTECSGTRSMYAWGIAWWGVWSVCWTDRCWTKECGLYSIPLFLFILFQPFFRQGFLIWYGYKEVITREDSFNIVWFDRYSYKTLRIASDYFFVWSSMVLPDLYFWECWYILASSKFFLIPSFLIIIRTRYRKKACCHPMGDRKTTTPYSGCNCYTIIDDRNP